MKKLLCVMVMLAMCGTAMAAPHKGHKAKAAKSEQTLTQAAPERVPNPPYPVTPESLVEKGGDIQTVVVEVQLGKGEENPLWSMSPTVLQVWLGKLQDEAVPPLDPRLSAGLVNPDPRYRGITVKMRTLAGHPFETLTVAGGKVTANGRLVKADPGRGLEYWLFSSARVKRDLLVGPKAVPVVTFEQCRLLGMDIVQTEPRQCLLPDKNILLETQERPTKASLAIRDFEGCLKHGKALIATFPRRCLAAGGRVFAEPPKLEQPPADAPLAVSGTAVSATAPLVTPTALVGPAVIAQPLLGSYAVSGTVSATQVVSEGLGLSGTMVGAAMGVSGAAPASAGTLVSMTLTTPTEIVPVSVTVPDVSPGAGPESFGDRVRRWILRTF